MRTRAELLEESDKRVGRTLRGKWRLDRLIGVGGMAAVFDAARVDGAPAGPARAAVKILHPEIARSSELTRRFRREAVAANDVKHPGAVGVLEADVDEDGCPFLVMELLEGESLLEQLSREGGIDPRKLCEHVDALLDVLAVAHDAGIVHRDVKLDNIFIAKNGSLKVLDFGIARLRSSSITMTGQRLGTIAYMPPEQVRGLEVDGRADLFAVGATMFRALAKRRVHEAPNEAALLIAMSTETAPPLRAVAPDVPEPVAAVVDRALAFYARERYPDARTMQADVRAVLRGERPPFAASLAATPPTGPSSRGSASGAATFSAGVDDDPTVAPAPSPPAHGPSSIGFEATAVAPPESMPGARPWSVGGAREVTSSRRPEWVLPVVIGVALALLALALLLVTKVV